MAGVESMIVEEKQPPTKQIDREKVNICPVQFLEIGIKLLKIPSKHLIFIDLDMSIVVACILFDWSSSFSFRISTR